MITLREEHINELKLKVFRNDLLLFLKENETVFCEEKDNDTLLNFIGETIKAYATSRTIAVYLQSSQFTLRLKEVKVDTGLHPS